MIRTRRPYVAPARSVAVPIIAHSGELVVPVKETQKLNCYLFSKRREMPEGLRNALKRLITTVPVSL